MVKAMRFIKLLRTPRVLFRKILHRYGRGFLGGQLLSFPSDTVILEEGKRELGDLKGARVVVFPGPSCPWGYLFQRPQQLAEAFSKKGYIVIYATDTSFPHEPDWSVRGLKCIGQNLFLFNDNREGALLPKLLRDADLMIWQYWPHQRSYVNRLSQDLSPKLIYDCIDHITTFDSYLGIEEDHLRTMTEAHLVVATAKRIHAEIGRYREDCLLIPNAVNIHDFPAPVPSLVEEHPERRITVGYYGAIAEWFDFESLQYAAAKNPSWRFLLVGEIYDQVQREAVKLGKLPNVEFRPRIGYSYIPNLLTQFDVAILPFKICDITLNTSPVKIFEYLAGGKVTVSTRLPEVTNLPGVLTAGTMQEFEQQLHTALKMRNDLSVINEMRNTAELNSWDGRVEIVIGHLSKDRGKE